MKIGLVAMSGIRACDRELVRMGLTLPGFVERSRTIASLPSLGLLTLAGMIPPWHEVSYHEVRDLGDEQRVPLDVDLVAISTFSAQVKEAYALADRLRAAGVRVVMGGPHVSVLPDEAATYCDAVVIGEGELSWPQVIADLERGSLRQRYGERGVPFDLARSPMPRFELLDVTRYNRITVQTSRGCPHRCEFCASTPLMTTGYRVKPIERILAEIDRIRAIWPHPFIEFADDNSFVDRRMWRELLPELERRRIRWFTETDISVADDEDLLDRMFSAGCAQVLIGLESPTTEALVGIDRHGWKARRSPRYHEAVRRIQDHGISVNGCFVVGLDGHGPEIFSAIPAFVREVELSEVQVTVQTPFPGTVLYERLNATGRLIDPTAWEKCTLFDVNFHPLRMTADELTAGFRQLVAELYTDAFTAERRQSFRRHRRAAHHARRLARRLTVE
jgi:radical SAM superfamily enzyme YgiQ (UPF0313 family)